MELGETERARPHLQPATVVGARIAPATQTTVAYSLPIRPHQWHGTLERPENDQLTETALDLWWQRVISIALDLSSTSPAGERRHRQADRTLVMRDGRGHCRTNPGALQPRRVNRSGQWHWFARRPRGAAPPATILLPLSPRSNTCSPGAATCKVCRSGGADGRPAGPASAGEQSDLAHQFLLSVISIRRISGRAARTHRRCSRTVPPFLGDLVQPSLPFVSTIRPCKIAQPEADLSTYVAGTHPAAHRTRGGTVIRPGKRSSAWRKLPRPGGSIQAEGYGGDPQRNGWFSLRCRARHSIQAGAARRRRNRQPGARCGRSGFAVAASAAGGSAADRHQRCAAAAGDAGARRTTLLRYGAGNYWRTRSTVPAHGSTCNRSELHTQRLASEATNDRYGNLASTPPCR